MKDKVEDVYGFIREVKQSLRQGTGAMLLNLSEMSLAMIKRKADPNYDDFFNQHPRKPLTIFPQLLIKGSIKKLVREVL